MAVVGELGAGKTLSLTYLAYRNFLKGKKIYSNYWLSFPHTRINSVEELDLMKSGFFAGDELWLWIDARASTSKKNKIVSSILLKSRKRDIHFSYTTQSFRQVDTRIRNVTDFIAIPMLSPQENWCRLLILTNPSHSTVKTIKFRTEEVFKMYNTREEISPIMSVLDEDNKPKKPKKKEDAIDQLQEEIKRLQQELKNEKSKKESKEIINKKEILKDKGILKEGHLYFGDENDKESKA